MARWLLKEEPSHYSYDDLARDGSTRWTGVHNALALRHLRRMARGDLALYYHTGSERACVGLVRITSAPQEDRDDPRGSWWVEVRAVRRLRRPVPLSEMKGDPAFADFDLLRISRLSVLEVPEAHWSGILARAEGPASVVDRATAAGRDRGRAGGRGRPRTAARRRH